MGRGWGSERRGGWGDFRVKGAGFRYGFVAVVVVIFCLFFLDDDDAYW